MIVVDCLFHRVPLYTNRQRSGSLTGPILANVTLTVVRFWGESTFSNHRNVKLGSGSKQIMAPPSLSLSLSLSLSRSHSLSLGNYMQMMNVLHPIAFDVLEYLTNLFDYYLYAVRD